MKRNLFVAVLVILLCLSFSACGGKKNADPSNNGSEITEGVGDASLDVDDIFSQGSESNSSGDKKDDSSKNNVSGTNSDGSSSADTSSENSADGDSSSGGNSESGNGKTDVSIDFEDPSVWTEPVGGQ